MVWNEKLLIITLSSVKLIKLFVRFSDELDAVCDGHSEVFILLKRTLCYLINK